MAKNNSGEDLAQLSLAELQARKNKLKAALIGLGIVMIVALVILLYVGIKNKTYGLLAIVPALLLSLMPGGIMLSRINGEISARQAGR